MKRRNREGEGMEEQGQRQSTSGVLKVDSPQTWDYYLSQSKEQGCPLVAHFSASWCMPSVAMNPVFEDLCSAYPDVMFLAVDVDDCKEAVSKMDVKAMPTFLLMRDGAVADKLVGANPEEIKRRVDGFVQSVDGNYVSQTH